MGPPQRSCPNCGSKNWAVNVNYNELPGRAPLEAPRIQDVTQSIDAGLKLIVQAYRCRKCSYLMFFSPDFSL